MEVSIHGKKQEKNCLDLIQSQLMNLSMTTVIFLPKVVDVRKPSENETTHIIAAKSLPLDDFPVDVGNSLDKEKDYILHCRSGYRSTIASSILLNWGFENITNVIGKF